MGDGREEEREKHVDKVMMKMKIKEKIRKENIGRIYSYRQT